MTLRHSEIELDPGPHAYRLRGVEVPAVSNILEAAGLCTNYDAVPAAVLEKARRRGTAIHAAAERISRGEDLGGSGEEFEDYIRGYRDFVQRVGWEAICSEIPVGHEGLLFAGTPDQVGKMTKGAACPVTIVDFKATAALDKKGTAVQLGGYAIGWDSMHPDQPIEEIAALWLRPGDQEARYVPLDLPLAKRVFLAAFQIWIFKHRSQ